MSEINATDQIQQLDQRHVQLIEELDDLNRRLEETLDSFLRPSGTDVEDGTAG
ncbi:MAG: hypothetical protein AAGD11_05650 [Planctomycetota bacterium]